MSLPIGCMLHLATPGKPTLAMPNSGSTLSEHDSELLVSSRAFPRDIKVPIDAYTPMALHRGICINWNFDISGKSTRRYEQL